MFGFIKGLFTSSPDKVFDAAAGIGNWIDGQQFTEQEKSEASFKALEYKLKWLNATQGMNFSQTLYQHDVLCDIFTVVYYMLVKRGFWTLA